MAAATMATIATVTNAKCMNKTTKQAKPISLFSIQNLPKGLNLKNPTTKANITSTTSGAVAGAIFTTLAKTDPAFAVQQIAEIAEGDNRGLALLIPIIPAIAWVLFNILQPALNQISRMRETKGLIIGLGLGGGLLASSGFVSAPQASAAIDDVATIAAEAAASGDSRGQLLLIVVTPAILWVLYNILQPALNQLNRMRSE